MKTVEVKFYKSNDKEPVRDWLYSDFDSQDRRTIGIKLQTIEFGWPMGMPLVRKLDKGLWEARIDISNARIVRILFTVTGDYLVLLHGFIKKSQQTPKKDLDLGNKRKSEVLR